MSVEGGESVVSDCVCESERERESGREREGERVSEGASHTVTSVKVGLHGIFRLFFVYL